MDIIKILEGLRPESTPDRYYVGWNEAIDAAIKRVRDMTTPIEPAKTEHIIPDTQIIAELRTLEKSLISGGQRIAAAVCRDAAARLSERLDRLESREKASHD